MENGDRQAIINAQRKLFQSGETLDFSFRKKRLDELYKGIERYEGQIKKALAADLRKSDFEAYATEIGYCLKEIRTVRKSLKGWMQPKKVRTPITHFGSQSYIYREPYGSALIIAPWNYPFMLAVSPLIGAIAGGNTAVLKPSEFTPHTSRLLAKLFSELYSDNYISVIEGDLKVSSELLEYQWDIIFFTGSTRVGKIVMKAAAEHLTPVVLELGGKSPCIVHKDANLKIAARRIAWGKFLNAGQTCIAPDYVYVHSQVKEELIDLIGKETANLFGGDPLKSEAYARIVNLDHFDRLNQLMRSGEVRFGGESDQESLSIAPTIIDSVGWSDAIMQEEIFGPLLPVLAYDDIDQTLQEIADRPKPLAFYIFSEGKVGKQALQRVSFGGGCLNDTIFHIANPNLPFGGVGQSGMGNYHGRHSFEAFTHSKSVLKQTTLFDISLRYPNSPLNFLVKKLLR